MPVGKKNSFSCVRQMWANQVEYGQKWNIDHQKLISMLIEIFAYYLISPITLYVWKFYKWKRTTIVLQYAYVEMKQKICANFEGICAWTAGRLSVNLLI